MPDAIFQGGINKRFSLFFLDNSAILAEPWDLVIDVSEGGGLSGKTRPTWTLKTPQIEGSTFFALGKIASGSLRLPWTREIFFDLAASRCAEGDAGSRVRARMRKSAPHFRRALTTAPPCLPVAPVTRIARDMVNASGGEYFVGFN